jgi:DNA-binding FadR family transcriptional regulator
MVRSGLEPSILARESAESDISRREGPLQGLPPPERRGASWIAVQLRQAIRSGSYAYGERLPAERDLAVGFGSSRGTVRAALSLLQQDGLVDRKVGSGTFVRHVPESIDDDVAEITSPGELMEVRRAVEGHMVRLAVVNATPRDIAQMEQALDELDRTGADPEAFTHWDQRFHLAMAEASHNPLMILFYRQINHVRGHSQWRTIKDKVLTKARMDAYNRQHRQVFEAIRQRDAETAVRLVVEHIEQAQRDLMPR